MSPYNKLKEIAISATSTDECIYDTIYIIVDYRVGIFPVTVTDTLLPHGAAEASFQSTQPTKWSFCRTW